MMYLVVHPMSKFRPLLVTGQLSEEDAKQAVYNYVREHFPQFSPLAVDGFVDESTVVEIDEPLTVIE